MYPYGYYPEYLPVQPEPYIPYDYSYIEQPNAYDIDRQRPQFQDLERRLRQLERQNEQQTREIERHTRRLNRLNQRLRDVENRLHIPFSPHEDGF